MREWQGKRYWLVGASEGLGLALAQQMSRAGVDLVLSARSADRLAEAVATLARPAQAVVCDVADTASVSKAAAEEGEDQLAAAFLRHPGLTVIPPAIAGIDPAWITTDGALRLRPDYWAERGGMDGFFMVCVQK